MDQELGVRWGPVGLELKCFSRDFKNLALWVLFFLELTVGLALG